jgi:purine-binding chemotaxis protein CheW
MEPVTRTRQHFLFSIEGRRYAMPPGCVERVVQAVAVTPLFDGPGIVLGVINLQGRIVPVVDLRRRLGLPDREVRLEDYLVIAQADSRTIAFFADSVEGVIEEPEGGVTEGRDVVPGLEYVEGVMRLGGDLVLIHDLSRVLSIEDQHRLPDAMGETAIYG